eukprot:6796940-Prymnesium_polylepis.2
MIRPMHVLHLPPPKLLLDAGLFPSRAAAERQLVDGSPCGCWRTPVFCSVGCLNFLRPCPTVDVASVLQIRSRKSTHPVTREHVGDGHVVNRLPRYLDVHVVEEPRRVDVVVNGGDAIPLRLLQQDDLWPLCSAGDFTTKGLDERGANLASISVAELELLEPCVL